MAVKDAEPLPDIVVDSLAVELWLPDDELVSVPLALCDCVPV